MAVRAGQVFLNLIQVTDKIESYMETRMAILCTHLEQWAKTEHDWQPDRPHTEGTIAAFLADVTPLLITARLQVDQDAGLWLELARNGRYAWIWPIFFNHQQDILTILQARPDGHLTATLNMNIGQQFEDLKAAYRAARASQSPSFDL